jgi:hypothetical protein
MPDEQPVGPAAERHHGGVAEDAVRGVGRIEHERRKQRACHHRAHRDLDDELMCGARCQALRARDRRGCHEEGDEGDDRHQDPLPRQPVRQADRRHRQLG